MHDMKWRHLILDKYKHHSLALDISSCKKKFVCIKVYPSNQYTALIILFNSIIGLITLTSLLIKWFIRIITLNDIMIILIMKSWIVDY